MSDLTLAQANHVIWEYAKRVIHEAYERVERERKGEGCGCASCAKEAVRDINSITAWISLQDSSHLMYEYNARTRRIIPPGG